MQLGEPPLAHTRRILCRMVGDLVLPTVFRSRATPPWAPDMHGGRVMLDEHCPFRTLPAQCDVGMAGMEAVSWADVVRLVPELADEAVLHGITATIRDRAGLLGSDSLALVHLGPRFARPAPSTPTGRGMGVSMHMPQALIIHCRPIDLSLAPEVHPDERLMFKPPHAAPADRCGQEANMRALRAHFHPTRFSPYLQVQLDAGMASLHLSGHRGDLPHAHLIYNQLWVRQCMLTFLSAALVHAPYRHRLEAFFKGPPSLAAVEQVVPQVRAHITHLASELGRLGVSRMRFWPHSPEDVKRATKQDFIIFSPDHVLMFLQPAAEDDREFLAALLKPDNYVLVPPTRTATALWYAIPPACHHMPHPV